MNLASTNTKAPQRGFSLVELMVALVLGLLLIGGTITVFSGGVKSSQFNSSLATIQSNARFAIDIMSNDVRMAGYQGCAELSRTALRISTAASPTTNFNNSAITGAVITASGWDPAQPPGYVAPAATGIPVVGTDALIVQYAATPGFPITQNMTGRNDDIRVFYSGSRFPLASGDLAVISDCNSAELITVDTISGGTAKVVNPNQGLEKAYALKSATDETVRLMAFNNAIYYIGDTGRTNKTGDIIYSLYQQSFPYTPATNPPIELIEGVDQLKLQFGIAQADGTTLYAAADDDDFLASNVISVRVGLLLSSFEQFSEVDDTREFLLAGNTVAPESATATGATYPADKRMRVPFSTTVSVRNRSALDFINP